VRTELAESVEANVERFVSANSRVRFYSPVYGGYVTTPARPATPSIFFAWAG